MGPRSRELYVALRRLIEAGQVVPGDKLPTTRDLAKRFAMSRAAAVAAFELLIAEGFVEARVGAGTFVAATVPHLASASRGVAAERVVIGPLVCALGVVFRDERSEATFRKLISRHFKRPGAEHFSYGDPRGGRALRAAIAAYLRVARGVRCEADQIVVTAGSQHALDMIARAVLRPSDAVLIEDPCFPKAHAALAAAGVSVIGVPVDEHGFDASHCETRHAAARAAYVTPSHQFPLGVTLTMPRRLALIDWARRNDAWIIEDDYHSEFRYSGPPLASLQGMDGAGRVAYVGSFSKALFPGLRVGYAVLPEALLGKVLDIRARSDGQPPTLAEGALADFLDEGHFSAHLRRARRRALAARDILVSGLKAHCLSRLTVTAPDQGLHVVARLNGGQVDRDVVDAMARAGVGGQALSSLFVEREPEQGLVLGFSGFTEAELRSAAERIGAVLNERGGPRPSRG